jgi:TonB family protein
MTPILIYFIKLNVALVLFYCFYRLFCCKDTFFRWRRTALLSFFGIALMLPLLNVQGWVSANVHTVELVQLYASVLQPEVTVSEPQAPAFSPLLFLSLVYWMGVTLLLGKLLIQLVTIVRMHLRYTQVTLKGVRVHLLPKAGVPFSFFNYIFIYPSSHTAAELDEILAHEQAHALQCHSVDVLVSELMCAFCWFNPACWGLKREVRRNLEYLADARVLATGHDSTAYQYHLLALALPMAAASISNNFKVLPLKNRIRMMNKRRTKKEQRTKYLMFLPLAALLLMLSNIETVARTAKTVVQNEPVTASAEPNIGTQVPDSVVFEMVEDLPRFPGGIDAQMEWMKKNIKYPVEAQKAGKEGRVIIQYVVWKDGTIRDVKVIKSADPLFSEEAIRLVKSMPNWTPGKQRGQAVNVKYTLPVVFKLPAAPAPAKAPAK